MLISVYRGWSIYYSPHPRPLWTATKGVEKDIYSFEGLDAIRRHIDKREDKK